jgi:hypothetical protein
MALVDAARDWCACRCPSQLRQHLLRLMLPQGAGLAHLACGKTMRSKLKRRIHGFLPCPGAHDSGS